MPGGSVYQQTKHKQWSGFQRAPRASRCLHCDGLAPKAQMFKGWCVQCLVEWGQTADKNVIATAAAEHAQRSFAVAPPTAAAYERLKNRIVERMPDEWFIPLTLYIGNYTVGRAQAMWNFVQAMYELELHTTVETFKLGQRSHDAIHLCGLHAPVQNSSLGSFLGRLVNTPETWQTIDPRIREYVRGFANDNKHVRLWMSPRRRISPVTTGPNHKCRRPYRLKPTTTRKLKAEWKAKYDVQPLSVPAFWPFAVRRAPEEHAMLHEIDRVTRGIPEQWRQDICQDLVVAVLSGDATVGNIQDAVGEHVRRIFKMHPVKYGALSLDSPVYDTGQHDDRTLGQLIAASALTDDWSEHEESIHAQELDERDMNAWHEGRGRPRGVATMGDISREKHGGVAVPGYTPPQEPEVMSGEVAEVYTQDLRPRGVHVRDGSRMRRPG